MKDLKDYTELRVIVNKLSTAFPDCSLTTDLEYYPWEDGTLLVLVDNVDVIAAKELIRNTIEVKHSRLLFRFNSGEKDPFDLKDFYKVN